MLKDLLRSVKLRSTIKKFRTPDIFDILLYGSIIRGDEKANDIDIVMIFKKKTDLNKKLSIAAALKDQLVFLDSEIDVKSIDISDLTDPAFIAREAILAEGFSLFDKEFLHRRFGFKAHSLFIYRLDRLTKSQKKMFYYALKGRRGQKGLLEGRGKQVGDCIIRIKLEYTSEFEVLLSSHNIEYSKEGILSYQ